MNNLQFNFTTFAFYFFFSFFCALSILALFEIWAWISDSNLDWFMEICWKFYEVLWTSGNILKECQIGASFVDNFTSLDKRENNNKKIYNNTFICLRFSKSPSITFPYCIFRQLLLMPILEHLRLTVSNEVQMMLKCFFSLSLDTNCISDVKFSWSIFDLEYTYIYIMCWFSKVCWL